MLIILLSMKYVLKIAFFKLYQTIFYLFKIDKVLTLIETYHQISSNVRIFEYPHSIRSDEFDGVLCVGEVVLMGIRYN
jgi:hypothetical protein